MGIAEDSTEIFLYEVVDMEMCVNCSHLAVCKYLEAAADTDNAVKELNDREVPIRVKLECDQYKPRSTNIKGAS